MDQNKEKKTDAIDVYLLNKLDADGVVRLRSVELAVAFSANKTLTPEEFSKIYEECYQFLSTNKNE